MESFDVIKALRRLGTESLVGAYGATAVAGLASLALEPLLGKRTDYLFIGPSFLLPALAGVAMAVTLRKRLRSSAYFAWVIPALLFWHGYLELARAPYPPVPEVWQHLVSAGCDSSECLYELFYTAPLVSSLTYTIAAAVFLNWPGLRPEKATVVSRMNQG